MSLAKTWTVQGFTTPAESQALAGKVIELISDYDGTQAERERLQRYMSQVYNYTIAQARDIDSLWGRDRYLKRSRRERLHGESATSNPCY